MSAKENKIGFWLTLGAIATVLGGTTYALASTPKKKRPKATAKEKAARKGLTVIEGGSSS